MNLKEIPVKLHSNAIALINTYMKCLFVNLQEITILHIFQLNIIF